MAVGIIVGTVLAIQFHMLPYGHALSSLLPSVTAPILAKRSFRTEDSSAPSTRVGELHLSSDFVNSNDSSVVPVLVKNASTSDMEGVIDQDNKLEENDRDSEIDFDLENERDLGDDLVLDEGRDPDGEFLIDWGDDVKAEGATDLYNGSMPKKASLHEKQLLQENNSGPGDNFALDNVRKSDTSVAVEIRSQDKDVAVPKITLSPIVSDMNWTVSGTLGSNLSNPLIPVVPNRPPSAKQTTEIISKAENPLLQSGPGTLNESPTTASIPLIKKKKKKQTVPPTSIPEMNRWLLRNRVSFRSMVRI